MKEVSVLRDVMRLGVGLVRLFRNSVGEGWQGSARRLANGDVLISNPRYIKFGLCEGSSDTVGWQSITITPEMVGTKVAVFVALECKTDTGRVSKEQQRFVDAVKNAGGIGAIVRSEGQARGVLERPAPAE